MKFLAAVWAALSKASNAADETLDAWYTPARASVGATLRPLIEHQEFEEVAASQRSVAEAKLTDRSSVEITPAVAAQLTGRAIVVPRGKRLFLVRSVRFATHGAYAVELGETSIHLHHRSLGFDAPIVRQGVVAVLEKEPKDVYATCSMAR